MPVLQEAVTRKKNQAKPKKQPTKIKKPLKPPPKPKQPKQLDGKTRQAPKANPPPKRKPRKQPKQLAKPKKRNVLKQKTKLASPPLLSNQPTRVKVLPRSLRSNRALLPVSMVPSHLSRPTTWMMHWMR